MQAMKRRLPIGIQTFEKIRESNFVYADKTARIYDLVSGSGRQVFLSRPRRFGKSLLCSTLKALYEGKRELFKSLAIDSLDWAWASHPVIHIDLNVGDYNGGGLDTLYANVNRYMDNACTQYQISQSEILPADRFSRLLQQLSEACQQKIVVIIDEYDKPLLSTIDNKDLHEKMRDALKGFYSVLKSADEYLEFVFLTGVTKFSKESIFSDLNHLTDISLDPRYADICGITQTELERDFAPEIEQVVADNGFDRDGYLEKMKMFYNGYRFSKKTLTVYNPFGLLNHFDKGGEFSSYWYASGTPTFLIRLIENQHIDVLHLEDYEVTSSSFHKFDVESMDAVPVLFQSGYLTIVDYDADEGIYTLDYPNTEVRSSFAQSLSEKYLRVPSKNLDVFITRFYASLRNGEIDTMMETVKVYIAGIQYDIIKDTEKFYQLVVYLIFTMMGLQCRSEVKIAAGRIDTLVETKKNVYCFEFKLNGTAEEALRQIDSKEYLLPWKGNGKQLFKVGVSFDREKRNVGEWKWAHL